MKGGRIDSCVRRFAQLVTAIGAATAAVLPVGCDRGDSSRGSDEIRTELTGPAKSGKPNLHVAPDGSVIATWFEPAGDDRHALRFAVREPGTASVPGRWSTPGTIAERGTFFVNWADFPTLIVTTDGAWTVHWLEKVAPGPYAYHVMLSRSTDRGTTWSAPIVPHADRSPTEHGFVAMARGPDGVTDLIWLDGRAMAKNSLGPMALRYATLAAEGTIGAEHLLDGQTCECCQAALARTTGGLIAAYRDRSDSETRDIAVVRQVEGEWTAPRIAVADGWEHRACPVNGPALVARGDTVALAWYTAPGEQPVAYIAFSTDGGATFGPKRRIDDGRPLGRVDVELAEDGSALVSWLEQADNEAEVRIRRLGRNGEASAATAIARTTRANASGFPRLALAGETLVVAWTASGDGGGVRVAAMPTSAIAGF